MLSPREQFGRKQSKSVCGNRYIYLTADVERFGQIYIVGRFDFNLFAVREADDGDSFCAEIDDAL
jgi:hypothetical protein